jgi:hypothetical protein
MGQLAVLVAMWKRSKFFYVDVEVELWVAAVDCSLFFPSSFF